MTDEIEVQLEERPDETPEVQIETAPEPAAPEKTETDIGIEELRKQLEAAQKRAEAAEQAQRQAQTQLQDTTRQVHKFRTDAEQAQYDAMLRALEAQTTQISVLEAEYAAALESGDYARAAKAQSGLTAAIYRKTQLEDGKAVMEQRQKMPQPVPQQAVDPLEARLATFTPRTANWLRQHPECLTEPRKQHQISAAHYSALAEGYVPDTDAYFQYVEERMGYRQPQQPAPAAPTTPAAPVAKPAATPAAPVTRESSGGARKIAGNTLRMTPKMRELAAISGLTEAEWAKNYIDMVNAGEIEPIH